MKLDHWLYCVIDGVVYVILFILLVGILRASLRLFARHEADDSPVKAVVSALLILLSVAVIPTIPLADKIGIFIVVPCLLAGSFILKCLCWVTLRQGGIIMLVFAVATLGLGKGSRLLTDKMLPKGRITLVKKMKISMGILEELSKLPDKEAVRNGSLLLQARMGLRLQRESFVSAVAILKDPQSLSRMTSQHTEDLDALGLLMDGNEKLTTNQLAELGIMNEDAREGAGVLQNISPTNAISENDVRDVVAFLKSVRKDGSEVTANDAVVVIREAMNRANQMSSNAALAMATNTVGGQMTGIATSVTMEISMEQTETSLVTQVSGFPETGAVAHVASRRQGDAFMMLSATEREAWMQSKSEITVTAKVIRKQGRSLAMVNGTMVGTGEVVTVTSRGRSYPWRLKTLTDDEVLWEPVLVGRDEAQMDFMPWN